MKRILRYMMICLLCIFVFQTPSSATPISPEVVQELREEIARARALIFLERRDNLSKRTKNLKRSNNKKSREEKASRRVRSIDREYNDRLEDAARTGNRDLWNEIKAEYDALRHQAILEDTRKEQAKAERCRRNRFCNSSLNK